MKLWSLWGIRDSSEKVWAPLTTASPDSRFLACGVPGQTEPYMAGSSAEAPLSILTLGFLCSVLGITDGKRDYKWIVTGREALGLGWSDGKERAEDTI